MMSYSITLIGLQSHALGGVSKMPRSGTAAAPWEYFAKDGAGAEIICYAIHVNQNNGWRKLNNEFSLIE